MKKLLFAVLMLSLLFAENAFAEAERRVYALTAPYLTTADDISFEELRCFWEGTCSAKFLSKILIADSEAEALADVFGCDHSAESVQILPVQDLDTQENILNAWMIVPFEKIEPRRKVITLDGMDILSSRLDVNQWPLTAVLGELEEGSSIKAIPVTNRDTSKLTNLVMTGVTAMVRATADYMDLDPLYPASLIREPLIDADILHISNEVPFSETCSTAMHYSALKFCSKPSYMTLLEDIGMDVVEIDGDHFQDAGDAAVEYTLNIYDEANIPYYGGGHNKADAQEPAILAHNGNTFAFLGCNGKSLGYAAASETRPGAVHCDMGLLTKQVAELKSQGIIPIVTFQHEEIYQEKPVDEVRADFEAVLNAGAVIVSGSQSHIPMEFDVYEDAFVHFGLGNLFFDQAFFLPSTAEAFIDRHVFYDGQYINTELLTIRFTNCALSHYMEEADRQTLLKRIFDVSEIRGFTNDASN